MLRDGYKFKSGADSSTMRPKKVILCVDDNEQDLSVLKFMLSTNGYRVLSASNGLEALEIFQENLIDLVLADYAMPSAAEREVEAWPAPNVSYSDSSRRRKPLIPPYCLIVGKSSRRPVRILCA